MNIHKAGDRPTCMLIKGRLYNFNPIYFLTNSANWCSHFLADRSICALKNNLLFLFRLSSEIRKKQSGSDQATQHCSNQSSTVSIHAHALEGQGTQKRVDWGRGKEKEEWLQRDTWSEVLELSCVTWSEPLRFFYLFTDLGKTELKQFF